MNDIVIAAHGSSGSPWCRGLVHFGDEPHLISAHGADAVGSNGGLAGVLWPTALRVRVRASAKGVLTAETTTGDPRKDLTTAAAWPPV